MSNEAIIVLHEDVSKGVTLWKEANYPYALLPFPLIIYKHTTRVKYQHAPGANYKV